MSNEGLTHGRPSPLAHKKSDTLLTVHFWPLAVFLKGCYGSIPGGQGVSVRWSHPMQMAGQVE